MKDATTKHAELAEKISAVLNDPNIPVPLYNMLTEGLNDIYNAMDQDAMAAFECSPMYIGFLLDNCESQRRKK